MRRHGRLLSALVVALVTVSGLAQGTDPAGYNRVLIPVFFTAAGSYGSFWTTTATASSRTSQPINAARPLFGGIPEPGNDCIPSTTVGAGNVCQRIVAPSGLIVYVPKTIARDDLQWDARVRDLSRSAETAGTQLPVVREEDFFTSGFMLPHVVVGPNFRSTLRVYSYQRNVQISVFIRPFPLNAGDVITVLDLQPPPDDGDPFPMQPSFAMIGDLTAAFPQLASARELSIEIKIAQLLALPAPAPNRAWGFVSTTNNATQQVTIVSPQ